MIYWTKHHKKVLVGHLYVEKYRIALLGLKGGMLP